MKIKRETISVFCIAAILLFGFTVSASGGIVLYEDFNSLAKDTVYMTNGIITETGGNKYMSATNDTTANKYVDITIPQTNAQTDKVVTIELDINVQSAGTARLCHVMPISGSVTISRVYYTTGIRADKVTTVYSVPGASSGGYATGVWNRVKMVLDFEHNKYYLYNNGTLVADGFGMADATVKSIDKLRLGSNGSASSAGSTTVWYDNISVYTSSENPIFTNENNINLLNTSLFTADFTNETLDSEPVQEGWNWTKSTDGNATVITRNGIDKAVRISNSTPGTENSDYYMQKLYTAQTGKFIVECDMRTVTGSTGSNGIIWVEDNVNKTLIRIYISTSLKIRDKDNGDRDLGAVTVGEWYKVRLVADAEKRKFDIYLDNMNIPAATDCDFIESLGGGTPSRIRIGVPRVSASDQTFQQDFDNLSVTPLQAEKAYIWTAIGKSVSSDSVISANKGLLIGFTSDFQNINSENVFIYDIDNDSIVNTDLSLEGYRAIRITPKTRLKEGGSYMLVVKDIEMNSKAMGNIISIPFTNRKIISSGFSVLVGEDSAVYSGVISCNEPVNENAVAFVAVYDENKLVDIKLEPVQIKSGDNLISVTYTGDVESKQVKGFVWDNTENLIPLAY